MVNTTPNSKPAASSPSEIAAAEADKQDSDTNKITISRQAVVPEELTGLRCDQIAAKLFPEYSRGKLQSWIASGELTVDGRQSKPRQKLFTGAQVALDAQITQISEWLAEPRPINIVFEDEHLLVINKPTNCVVHPAPGLPTGTLVNSILAHCPGNSALPRGGIVHRLDKDTTGLMVVAKSLEAHTSLVRQLQERSVKRIYRTVICGHLISGGTVDAAMGRHPTVRTKMAVAKNPNSQGAKPAITHYRIAERFRQHIELTIKLETGRTHQIRVHMAHIRHPLVGDKTYNSRYKQSRGISEECNETLKAFPRQALHAFELSFEHPTKDEHCSFQCDVPDDYQTLIDALRKDALIKTEL